MLKLKEKEFRLVSTKTFQMKDYAGKKSSQSNILQNVLHRNQKEHSALLDGI